MCNNPIIILRDLKYFALSYTAAISCAFIPNKAIKCAIAALLIIYYMWYVKRTLKKDFGCDAGDCEVNELILLKCLKAKMALKKVLIFAQIIISLALLVVLAHLFVNQIKYFSELLNLPPLVVSLLIAPIATELPECFNSVLWIGNSKDSLSVSNITGALVFQSCIPAAIGIIFTPWMFNLSAVVSVALVYASLMWVYVNAMKNKGMLTPKILTVCGLFYLIYIVYVLKMLI